jgi:hypothetical protein
MENEVSVKGQDRENSEDRRVGLKEIETYPSKKEVCDLRDLEKQRSGQDREDRNIRPKEGKSFFFESTPCDSRDLRDLEKSATVNFNRTNTPKHARWLCNCTL